MFNKLPKKFKVNELQDMSREALAVNDLELYMQCITFYKYFIA